jgi:hypothetical protein
VHFLVFTLSTCIQLHLLIFTWINLDPLAFTVQRGMRTIFHDKTQNETSPKLMNLRFRYQVFLIFKIWRRPGQDQEWTFVKLISLNNIIGQSLWMYKKPPFRMKIIAWKQRLAIIIVYNTDYCTSIKFSNSNLQILKSLQNNLVQSKTEKLYGFVWHLFWMF